MNSSDLIFQFVIVMSPAMNLELQGCGKVLVFVMAMENRTIMSTNMDKLESGLMLVEIKIVVRITKSFYLSHIIFGSSNAVATSMTIAEVQSGRLVAVFAVGDTKHVIVSANF